MDILKQALKQASKILTEKEMYRMQGIGTSGVASRSRHTDLPLPPTTPHGNIFT